MITRQYVAQTSMGGNEADFILLEVKAIGTLNFVYRKSCLQCLQRISWKLQARAPDIYLIRCQIQKSRRRRPDGSRRKSWKASFFHDFEWPETIGILGGRQGLYLSADGCHD